MFRFVAFVWDDTDNGAQADAQAHSLRLCEASPAWRVAFATSGVQVLCADVRAGSSEPYLLQGGGGVVLGKLFRRFGSTGSACAPLSLTEEESRRIVATGGRRLVETYWGRYVAILRDGTAGITRILRDPTAALPCFTARLGRVEVYFSCMEDFSQLGRQSFSVNWKYVAGMLCQSQLQVHSTGLNEVGQVLGGECIEHQHGAASREFYWNPLEIAQTDVIEDATEAAGALRETTRDCVQSWASSYEGIVHLLSGGLDSSIVLSCLKDAPTRPRITCLNYYSTGCNTDERDYAQLAAADSQFPLFERERNSALTLEPLLRVRRSASPMDYFFYLDEGRSEAELASEHGAQAVFTGYGGDQLFYRSRATFAAEDYLASHGIGTALFNVALDAAHMDRTSVWSVLGQAARTRLLRRTWRLADEPLRGPRSVVRAEVARDINRDSDLVHPWLQACSGAPNGKVWHAYQLLFPMNFYHPLGAEADPEVVTPLFSQPLLELAMRIPTWLLTHGGWDRAMARRAFQHDVPRRIVTRRTKGGQEEHAKAILVRNLPFARSLLLEGHLVREHILERSQVAEALSQKPGGLSAGNVEIYACLSTEAWVRQWATA